MLFNIHFQKWSKAVTVEENDDWGFSHDVTKIQTKKLSIFLSFTFFRHYSTWKPFFTKIFGSKGLFISKTLEFFTVLEGGE